jgi:putative ABC transport system permease protein
MQLFALAFRNLVRQKRRTAFLAAAVAIGFAVVALLVGLTGGMVATLKDNLSHAYGGHLFVMAAEWNANGKLVSVIREPSGLEAALSSIDGIVRSFHRRSSVETTLVFGSKTAQVRLTGVEWERESDVRATLTASAGSIPSVVGPGQLLLNTETASRLGIKSGDQLLLKFKTLDGQQSVLDATVAALIQTAGGGMFNSDSYVSLAQANLMLGIQSDQYQSLCVYLKDMDSQAEAAALLEKTLVTTAKVRLRADNKPRDDPMGARMDQLLGGDESQPKWPGPRYAVSILDDFMSLFVSLIGTIKTVTLVIFMIMMAVIVIGISNTFQMVLRERTVEIGTLRALGLRKKGVLTVFLAEAAAVILSGLAGGSILALLVGGILSALRLKLDETLSMFLAQGHVRFDPEPTQIAGALAFVLCAGLFAAWRPARHAADLLPADALRHRT